MKKNISVCLTFDFDAMSVWIGTFRATSPSVISRGEFGRVATERLLRTLREWDIRCDVVYPRTYRRRLSRDRRQNRRRRSRDRASRLFP